MALHPDLNQAIATQGGGRVALIVGAGCSLEPPTSVPLARTCSQEVYAQLMADGILAEGDCAHPDDLAALADAVFAKTHSQQALVSRLRERYSLHAKPPNEGYLIAAALLCEGAIGSIVTLNFDVGLTSAISDLTCADVVGIIEGPHQLPQQKARNIYYLHRSANAVDPETWVLRTHAIQAEWQGQWEQAITQQVLIRPVVVFVGLGSPADVLVESTQVLRAAIPGATRLFQVDPGDHAQSRLSQQLNLPVGDYVRLGWCDFMRELSERLLREHATRIVTAAAQKANDDAIANENLAPVLDQLRVLGIVNAGKLRAMWFNDKKSYLPVEGNTPPLVADLLLGIVLAGRVSNATVTITDDGIAEFRRGAVLAAVIVIVSGVGHMRMATIEAHTNKRKLGWRARAAQPSAALVAGVSEVRPAPTPPADVIRGNVSERDIIAGPGNLTYYHVDELRQHPERIAQLVP